MFYYPFFSYIDFGSIAIPLADLSTSFHSLFEAMQFHLRNLFPAHDVKLPVTFGQKQWKVARWNYCIYIGYIDLWCHIARGWWRGNTGWLTKSIKKGTRKCDEPQQQSSNLAIINAQAPHKGNSSIKKATRVFQPFGNKVAINRFWTDDITRARSFFILFFFF